VDWPPVLAATIAAAAALTGYWLTYASKRSESKTETYAKALAAVEAYKQLPYRICRRGESTPEVRGNLGKVIGDVQQDLAFYRRFLLLDSEAVGLAYGFLVDKVYNSGRVFRAKAWCMPPASEDKGMDISAAFDYDDASEQRTCLLAMQRELRRRFRLGLRTAPPRLNGASSGHVGRSRVFRSHVSSPASRSGARPICGSSAPASQFDSASVPAAQARRIWMKSRSRMRATITADP
jgi:hypothetical protein